MNNIMADIWLWILNGASDAWEIIKATKAEVWAGWFQAVGSLISIVVAYKMGRHQTDVSRALANEDFARQNEAVSACATVQVVNTSNELRRIREIIGDKEANMAVLEKSGADAALTDLLFTSTSVDSYILSSASFLPQEARLSFPQLIACKEMYNARMRELYQRLEKAGETDLAAVNNLSHHLLFAVEALLNDVRSSAGIVNDAAVLQTRADK